MTNRAQFSFPELARGEAAIAKLLRDYAFESVLDLGCGAGEHLRIFRAYGKLADGIDRAPKCPAIRADYMRHEFDRPYDAVWCCHVLEHQTDPGAFLRKIRHDLVRDGILAITVPPAKAEIVPGHLTIWNAGLLLANLVTAGFDCSQAAVKTYGYNVSAICRNGNGLVPDSPWEAQRPFVPANLPWPNFDGRIGSLNWEAAA